MKQVRVKILSDFHILAYTSLNHNNNNKRNGALEGSFCFMQIGFGI